MPSYSSFTYCNLVKRRTSSHKVGSLEKYSLFCYNRIPYSNNNNSDSSNNSTTTLPAPRIP